MRTKITAQAPNRVTIETTWRIREFYCPAGGGYVREYIRGDLVQVCDGLSHMGNTLVNGDTARWPLVDLIRAEYRAVQREQRRA